MERNWLRDNGLTLALLTLFLISIVGHALTGWSAYNEEQLQHASERIGLAQYLGSGHFTSTVFENWESEFLQMAIFVVLTAYLFQRGSPESKDPDVSPAAEKAATTRDMKKARAPSWRRAGGVALFEEPGDRDDGALPAVILAAPVWERETWG